jgi:hypothetical protein
MVELKEKNGKIPIKIVGGPNFALVGGIEDFTFGTFCGMSFAQNLEEGIQDVIDTLKFNAKGYLQRMVKGLESGEYEDLAFKIITYKGNLQDLFCLKYYKTDKEKIELQLGRFSKLEAVVT